MSRMPGAIWKPLAADWANQPRMRAHNIVCIHTMVGGLDGTDALFRVNNGAGYDGTESHFGTGGDGRIVEWQDILYQADANYAGNGEVVSIENADHGPEFPTWSGSDVPALTPQQIEADAQILAWVSSPAAHADCPPTWICHREGIPLELIPDSKPGRRGVAPHRWGVPGYMAPGAVQWSTSRGKACPGDRRIAQIPQIIARAKAIRGGAGALPIPSGDDDMELLVDNKGNYFVFGYYSLDPVTDGVELAHLKFLLGEAKFRNQADIEVLRNGAATRRGALLVALAKAAGGDVDEAAIVAGLIPAITQALAGKTGATIEEITAALRGITLKAS